MATTTFHEYDGNGSNKDFNYTFPTYASTEVKVLVNQVLVDNWTIVSWSASGTNIVRFDNTTGTTNTDVCESSGAPKNTLKVRVYRDTSVDAAKATYVAGSSIKKDDLNDNQTQILRALQEEQNRSFTTGDIRDDAITGAKIADDQINSEHYVAGSIDLEHMSANSVDSDQYVDGSIDLAHMSANSVDSDQYVDGSIDLIHMSANSVDSDQYVDGSIDHVHLANDVIDGDNIQDDVVNSEHIAAGAVDLEHMSANSVDSDQYVDGSIDRIHLEADIIDSTKLADNSVNSEHYVDGSIDREHLVADIIDGTKIADDAIGAEHIQANAVGTSEIADAELVTLAGMQSGTASILASGTALTSTTAELNLLDGKSVVTAVSGSSTDNQLPTAKAVNDQIVSTISDVGGFVPVANELSFPNTNPDPGDNAGTIVSIADAGGIVVNGSGVSTTGRTLGGATVTINGIDSTLNNTTIAAGKGMLVQTTTTLNTYDYHRLVVDEAGVASAQTLVTDFNQRYQVAGSAPSQQPDGTALAEGDLWFDTSANTMKVYDGSQYSVVTSVGDYKLLTILDTDGSAFDGANQTFNLKDGSSAAAVTSAGQLIISVNGVIQKPNSGTSAPAEGFALVDADTIIFSNAPGAGAAVFVTLIGSATGVNTPATNSIVEAAIQANVVSEEKLKISNAGSNGQFLSKQSGDSGGLTWASVTGTPEGTAVLSTGESGGTKFLREDGDGTCSWQAVPAGVTQENVEDWVGGMVTGNTETGITVTYEDADGTLDFVVGTLNQDTTGTADHVTITDNENTNENNLIPFVEDAGGAGSRGLESDGDFHYNPSTGTVTATSFAGSGANLTGVASTSANGTMYKNTLSITDAHTIAATEGAHSVGPISVGNTVTVSGRWVIS